MIEDLAEIVCDIGALLLKWRDAGICEGHWEGTQFKACADRMAHRALTEGLKRIAPAIPIISEEDEVSIRGKRPDCYWLIDPIDGTASFAGGFPGFVTQAALMKDGCPSVAAIYAPVFDLLYLAVRGEGATLNGRPLRLSPDGKPAILIDNYPEPRGVARAVYEDLNFRRYIECGSISLKICRIADGTADLFFKDVIVQDWDVAAPQLVLEEAGGILRDCRGRKIRFDGVGTEYEGLVAASTPGACRAVVSWYENFQKKEGCHGCADSRRSSRR